MTRSLGLVVRNVVFTVVVPGLGGALLPWWLLTHGHGMPAPAAWEGVPVIAAGAALYFWCAWNFASGGGVAVHLAAAARLRGRHGGVLPPVRHRLRGTDAGPPLRPRLPGVPARRPALDPAQAGLPCGRRHHRGREVAGLMGG